MRRAPVLAVAIALIVPGCSKAGRAGVAPPLAPPPIDPRLESLSQGELVLDIAANARQNIDPLALARQAGTPPACADFIFLFSWRTERSTPVSFAGNRQGGEFDIAQRPAGAASVNRCILLQVKNDAADPVKGEMRYVIAQTRR